MISSSLGICIPEEDLFSWSAPLIGSELSASNSCNETGNCLFLGVTRHKTSCQARPAIGGTTKWVFRVCFIGRRLGVVP
jgi:hypothetical protein